MLRKLRVSRRGAARTGRGVQSRAQKGSDVGKILVKVLDWLWRDDEGERGKTEGSAYGYTCGITPVDDSTVVDKPLRSVDVFDGV